MPETDMSNRTHEPSLREITSEVDGLRSLILARLDAMEKLAEERDDHHMSLNNERDRRYEEAKVATKQAVDAAFEAAQEAVSQALTSAKESSAKQELSQATYNATHNDLQRKMEAQHKETLPRIEADGRFGRQDEKIEDVKKMTEDLRLHQSRAAGAGEGQKNTISNIQVAITVLLGLIALGLYILPALTR